MSVSSSFCVNGALSCSSVSAALWLLLCRSVTLVCRDCSLFCVVAVCVACACDMLRRLSCHLVVSSGCGPLYFSCEWGELIPELVGCCTVSVVRISIVFSVGFRVIF